MTTILTRYIDPKFSPLSEAQGVAVKAHREIIRKANKTPPEGWTTRGDIYTLDTLQSKLLLYANPTEAASQFASLASKWIQQIFDHRRVIRSREVNARKVSSIFKYMATKKPDDYDIISTRLVQLLNEIATAGTYNEEEIKLIISKFIIHSLVYFKFIEVEFRMPNY
jgi:hypothetical protein